MKFLHLADLHLGKSLGAFDLADDQKHILNQILGIVKEKGVDAVLIAGDVYDKAVPSETAVNLLNDFLNSLAEMNVTTFMISGNHDSDDRLNFGSRLFEKNQLYITSVYDGILHKKALYDEHGEVTFFMMPFVKASQVKHYFPEEKITSYDEAVRVIIKNASIDPAKRNVIIAHQFVAGQSDPLLGGSEAFRTQSVGTVERIGSDCFSPFDYVALGHIHSSQYVGREEVRYAGSPLKYSLSEVNNDKSVPLVTLGKKGDTTIELLPLRPLRDIRHLKGPLKCLLDADNVQDPQDYIYATLTDDEIITDVMGLFQQVYPYTVRIDFDNAHTRILEQVDIPTLTETKSVLAVISEFYEKIYNCAISEEEKEVLRTVAKEAKVTL